LEALAKTHPVDVYWHAFELRPKGSPPMPPEYQARIEAFRPQFHQIARERYSVEMNPGPSGMDSRPAHIGAKVAAAHGRGAEFHDRALRAYWQEARAIDAPDALLSIAEAVGLEREDFAAALRNPVFERQVDEDIAQAAAYGLSGVPALIFAGKYLVSGAQPADVLRRIVEKVREESV
jgi:predicted DsbA family dithiol-disulfide isomerase